MSNLIWKTTLCLFAAAIAAGCFSVDSGTNRSRTTPTSTPSKADSSPSGATPTASNEMKENSNNKPKSGGFASNLPSGFVQPQDEVGRKMMREYGAMFVAKGVTPPSKLAFTSESEVSSFHSSVQSSTENVGGFSVQLQSAAMTALKEAIADARSKGLDITPRNADSSKRSYSQTVDNWKSRVDPGLKHWVSKGRITKADADRITALSPPDQVPEIFKLESQGIYFSKDLSKSIIYSVAPPGMSQHISLLALDVEQNDNGAGRAVLADHGWFQTVISDLPHFTYLGVKASELSGLGLKKSSSGDRDYWVPDI